jgi:hypothetical protein
VKILKTIFYCTIITIITTFLIGYYFAGFNTKYWSSVLQITGLFYALLMLGTISDGVSIKKRLSVFTILVHAIAFMLCIVGLIFLNSFGGFPPVQTLSDPFYILLSHYKGWVVTMFVSVVISFITANILIRLPNEDNHSKPMRKRKNWTKCLDEYIKQSKQGPWYHGE